MKIICPECHGNNIKKDLDKKEICCEDCGLVIVGLDPEYVNGIRIKHPVDEAKMLAEWVEKNLPKGNEIPSNVEFDIFDYHVPLSNRAPAK